MGTFIRQLYKQKPQAWGPVSAVKASIFKNAERAGIDPGSIALCMPMWGPGDQIDYSKNGFIGINSNIAYAKNSLVYNGSTSTLRVSNKPVLPSMTVLSRCTPAIVNNYNFLVTRDDTAIETANWWFGIEKTGKLTFAANINSSWNGSLSDNDVVSANVPVVVGCSYNINTNIISIYARGTAVPISSPTRAGGLLSTHEINIGCRKLGTTGSGAVWNGSIDFVLICNLALDAATIAYISDNPYFLLHRVPPVFYSVPGGGVLPIFNPLFLNAAQPTRVIQ